MELEIKDKKNINKMVLVSIMILIFVGVFFNKLNNIKILLYAICALVGIFSIRYTFVIIILTSTSFLSMYNIEVIGGIPSLGYVAGAMCFISETFKYLKNKKYRIPIKLVYNGFFILFLILLLSCSIFVANVRYGQPIIRGLFSFRYILLTLYIYPFTKLLKSNKNEKIVIMEFLTKLLFFSIIAIIIQSLIIDKFQFLKLIQGARYDEKRIMIHTVSALYCIVYAYNLNILFETKKIDKYRILVLLLIAVAIIVLSKTRMFIIGICAITFFEILIFSNIKLVNKIFLSIMGFFTALIILFGTNFIANLANGLFRDVATQKDSYIRFEAINYYMNLIKDKNFLLGGGIVNEKYPLSPIHTAGTMGYLLADIGIFAVFFEYGIMGLIAVFLLTISIFRKSLKTKDRLIANLAKLFCVFIVITMYTVLPLGPSVWILFIMIYSMLISEERIT